MEKESRDIDLIIANYLSQEATEAENAELKNWIESSLPNKRYFEEYKRIWDKSHTYFPQTEVLADQLKIKDQIISQLTNEEPERNASIWLYRAAAVLTIPILLGIGWYLGNSNNRDNNVLCEVSTSKGQISKCTLADGTEVWLNAGTTLKYPSVMTGKLREVNLDGEAYFKVAKNKHKPFVVNTQFAQIKVLGTVFDLKAYSADDNVETTLEEGSVEFKIKGSSAKPVELKPGEQVIFNKSEQKMTTGMVDTYLHTAWKDGKYVFKNAELRTIIHELERLYDVKFHVANDSLLNLRFRGMFEYDQDIFSAMERLELTTNVKYKMEGRQIWLK